MVDKIDQTNAPTSHGYTAKVVQTGQLGTYALQINGDHAKVELFGSLQDLATLSNQIVVDIQRQSEMAHVWWVPEVEA